MKVDTGLIGHFKKKRGHTQMILRNNTRLIFVAAVWCLSVLTACGTKHVNLEDQSSGGSLRTVLLREVEYDQNGMPLFIKTLNKRPDDPGEKFTIGLFRDNMPVKTFDIAIKRTHGDLMVPLRIVYHWTGEGFEVGGLVGFLLISAVMDSSEASARDLKNAAGAAAVSTVVGGAGGFVVGLAKSAPSGWAETEKIVLRAQESIVTYTEYEYNELGQLSHMTMYEPETRVSIVKTDFYYEDDRNIPAAAYVTSYPENKVRVIPVERGKQRF